MAGEKILVVDDEALVVETLEKVLEQEEFEVVTATSGRSALEKAQSNNFDLVVTDIRMPGKDGVESAREISRLFRQNAKKDIPIIFITGFADLASTLKAEKLGEVIMKPFDLDRFLMTIREYL